MPPKQGGLRDAGPGQNCYLSERGWPPILKCSPFPQLVQCAIRISLIPLCEIREDIPRSVSNIFNLSRRASFHVEKRC